MDVVHALAPEEEVVLIVAPSLDIDNPLLPTKDLCYIDFFFLRCFQRYELDLPICLFLLFILLVENDLATGREGLENLGFGGNRVMFKGSD